MPESTFCASHSNCCAWPFTVVLLSLDYIELTGRMSRRSHYELGRPIMQRNAETDSDIQAKTYGITCRQDLVYNAFPIWKMPESTFCASHSCALLFTVVLLCRLYGAHWADVTSQSLWARIVRLCRVTRKLDSEIQAEAYGIKERMIYITERTGNILSRKLEAT